MTKAASSSSADPLEQAEVVLPRLALGQLRSVELPTAIGRTAVGKRIQITKSGFGTRKEATEALRKAIERHRFDDTNHLRFSAFLDRWLDEYAKHRCTPKTLERYETLGRHATKYLGEIELQGLDPWRSRACLITCSTVAGEKTKLIRMGGRCQLEQCGT